MTLFAQLRLTALGLDNVERRVTLTPDHPPVFEKLLLGVWVEAAVDVELLETMRAMAKEAIEKL